MTGPSRPRLSGFLSTSEPAEPSPPGEAGRSDVVARGWFGFSASVLTFLALLCLWAPRTALDWMFPCLSSTFDAHGGELASLKVSMLAAGSHLAALATASWFATAAPTTNRSLRQAVTLSSIVFGALTFALPLRQIVQQGGWACVRSPILLPIVLLLVGWVAYASLSLLQGETWTRKLSKPRSTTF